MHGHVQVLGQTFEEEGKLPKYLDFLFFFPSLFHLASQREAKVFVNLKDALMKEMRKVKEDVCIAAP